MHVDIWQDVVKYRVGPLSFVEFLMAYVTMGTPRFVRGQVGRKLALHSILKTLVKFPAMLGERNRTEMFVREEQCSAHAHGYFLVPPAYTSRLFLACP